MTGEDDENALGRIAAVLERLIPGAAGGAELSGAEGFVWQAASLSLRPIEVINRIPLGLLKGIDTVRDLLLENTRRFTQGLPANNALLWGARGMGKSSLIKAVHGAIVAESPGALALVEIHREDIASLPGLLRLLGVQERNSVVFCDDLSFNGGTAFQSLKGALEGGLEGRPSNVLFYATSNRRHMMPRQMIENERSTAINPAEVADEKVSLSDRFGLWLGFHAAAQDDYFAMVEGYAEHFRLDVGRDELRAQAIEWSMTRGARSGRVAWQFIQDLAGRMGVPLE